MCYVFQDKQKEKKKAGSKDEEGGGKEGDQIEIGTVKIEEGSHEATPEAGEGEAEIKDGMTLMSSYCDCFTL